MPPLYRQLNSAHAPSRTSRDEFCRSETATHLTGEEQLNPGLRPPHDHLTLSNVTPEPNVPTWTGSFNDSWFSLEGYPWSHSMSTAMQDPQPLFVNAPTRLHCPIISDSDPACMLSTMNPGSVPCHTSSIYIHSQELTSLPIDTPYAYAAADPSFHRGIPPQSDRDDHYDSYMTSSDSQGSSVASQRRPSSSICHIGMMRTKTKFMSASFPTTRAPLYPTVPRGPSRRSTRPPISWVPDCRASLQNALTPNGILWSSKYVCQWGNCECIICRDSFSRYEDYLRTVFKHFSMHAQEDPRGNVFCCRWDGCQTRWTQGQQRLRDKVRHLSTHLPWFTICTRCAKITARRDARGRKSPCRSQCCKPLKHLATRVQRAHDTLSERDFSIPHFCAIVFSDDGCNA